MVIHLSSLQIFPIQQWQWQRLTSQISHSRSQAHPGRQCAVIWWSSAEQDVIWQGLVYHWASGAGIGRPPSIATYALIREGAVKCPPRGKVPIEGKLRIKRRIHIVLRLKWFIQSYTIISSWECSSGQALWNFWTNTEDQKFLPPCQIYWALKSYWIGYSDFLSIFWNISSWINQILCSFIYHEMLSENFIALWQQCFTEMYIRLPTLATCMQDYT